MLFELLTAVAAFPIVSASDLGTSVGVARAIRISRETPAPAPSRFRAGITPALDSVVSKALALSPGDRYPSAREFEQALTTLPPF